MPYHPAAAQRMLRPLNPGHSTVEILAVSIWVMLIQRIRACGALCKGSCKMNTQPRRPFFCPRQQFVRWGTRFSRCLVWGGNLSGPPLCYFPGGPLSGPTEGCELAPSPIRCAADLPDGTTCGEM